jgi:hypothetical protein
VDPRSVNYSVCRRTDSVEGDLEGVQGGPSTGCSSVFGACRWDPGPWSPGVWPQTVVQTLPVHLLRNSFRYASRKDWSQIAKDLKPVYTAPSEAAAVDRFAGVRRQVGEA